MYGNKTSAALSVAEMSCHTLLEFLSYYKLIKNNYNLVICALGILFVL